MSNLIKFFAILIMLLYWGCSDNSVDGSGTGTGNPIILGQVISDEDSAFANVSVKLRPANYFLDDSLSFISENEFYKIRNVLTDLNGRFMIDSVDSGEYVIEVCGKNNKSVIYKCSINLDLDTLELAYTPVLQNDTIKGYSAVFGGTDSEKDIYIEGLDRKSSTLNGFFNIVVPAGTYSLKAVTERGEEGIIKEVASYCSSATINVLAENPISNNYICDTLIVRAILDSNNISRSVLYHAFSYGDDDDDKFVYQVDIEDPAFHTLPPIIGGMRNLLELEIQFGNLSEIPPEIGLLTKIRELELNDNLLTSLPIEITNLSPINELNLSGNQFENLPQQIVDWGNTYNALW